MLLRISVIGVIVTTSTALGSPGGTPDVSAAIGPNGLADPSQGDPYYLWIASTHFVPPHPSDGTEEDCSPRSHPDPASAAASFVFRLLEWDPFPSLAISGWFPTCVATEVESMCVPSTLPPDHCDSPLARMYVAYDVTNGNYFLSAEAFTELGLKPSAEYGGNTGMGVSADCADCPPPVCC